MQSSTFWIWLFSLGSSMRIIAGCSRTTRSFGWTKLPLPLPVPLATAAKKPREHGSSSLRKVRYKDYVEELQSMRPTWSWNLVTSDVTETCFDLTQSIQSSFFTVFTSLLKTVVQLLRDRTKQGFVSTRYLSRPDFVNILLSEG